MIGRSLETHRRVSVDKSKEGSAAGRRRGGTALFGKILSWLRPRSRSRSTPASAANSHIQLTNPWHAVSIAANKRCCQASAALKRRRFLSGEAPRLPLEDCGQPAKCICVYKHFNDRRGGFRRAAERDLSARPYARVATSTRSQERRRSKGRRATDGH
jgi:hypothetical protein